MKYNNLLKSEGAALNLLFGNGKGFRIYQAKKLFVLTDGDAGGQLKLAGKMLCAAICQYFGNA